MHNMANMNHKQSKTSSQRICMITIHNTIQINNNQYLLLQVNNPATSYSRSMVLHIQQIYGSYW